MVEQSRPAFKWEASKKVKLCTSREYLDLSRFKMRIKAGLFVGGEADKLSGRANPSEWESHLHQSGSVFASRLIKFSRTLIERIQFRFQKRSFAARLYHSL
jgi:hypothetical protein